MQALFKTFHLCRLIDCNGPLVFTKPPKPQQWKHDDNGDGDDDAATTAVTATAATATVAATVAIVCLSVYGLPHQVTI